MDWLRSWWDISDGIWHDGVERGRHTVRMVKWTIIGLSLTILCIAGLMFMWDEGSFGVESGDGGRKRSLAGGDGTAPLRRITNSTPTSSDIHYHPRTEVTIAFVISTSLSILSCLLVLLTYVLYPKLRRHPSELIVGRTVFDLMFCVATLSSHLYFRASEDSHATGVDPALRHVSDRDCLGFSFVTELAGVSAEGYVGALALDLVVSVSNPFANPRTLSRLYHMFVIGVGLALAITVASVRRKDEPIFARDNYLDICWIRRYDGGGDSPSSASPYFVALFVVPLGLIYTFAFYSGIFSRNRLLRGLPQTFGARSEALTSTMRFVSIFTAYWLVLSGTFIGIYEIDDKNPPFGLTIALALGMGSRGLITGCIWVLTYDIAGAVASAERDGGAVASRDLRPQINQALRKEVLYYTTFGIRRAVLYARRYPLTDFTAALSGNPVHYNRIRLPREYEEGWKDGASRAKARKERRERRRRRLRRLRAMEGGKEQLLSARARGSIRSSTRTAGQIREDMDRVFRAHSTQQGRSSHRHKLGGRGDGGDDDEEGVVEGERGEREEEDAKDRLLRSGALDDVLRADKSSRERKEDLMTDSLTEGSEKIPVHARLFVKGSVSGSSDDTSEAGERGIMALIHREASDVDPRNPQPLQFLPPPQGEGGDGGDDGVDDIDVGGSMEEVRSGRVSSTMADQEPLRPGRGSINGPPLARGPSGLRTSVPVGREADSYDMSHGGFGPGHFEHDERGHGGDGKGPGTPRPLLKALERRGMGDDGDADEGLRVGEGSSPILSSSGTESEDGMKRSPARAGTHGRGARGRMVEEGCCTDPGGVSCLYSPYLTCGVDCAESSAFVFVDFEPQAFRRIRTISGIDDKEYLAALSVTKREKFSEGASGAFLYFSKDERFIVKTMSRSECHVLLGMLRSYRRHLERYPGSLITRFYGCHAIRMYGITMYFCVMENVLFAPGVLLHERYDLKGSWVNRHRVPLEKGRWTECRYCSQRFRVGDPRRINRCPARPNRTHVAKTILKDNDLNQKLRLDRATALALGDQIVEDSSFLRRHGIMDYSLLLGVHREKYRLWTPTDGPIDRPGNDNLSGSDSVTSTPSSPLAPRGSVDSPPSTSGRGGRLYHPEFFPQDEVSTRDDDTTVLQDSSRRGSQYSLRERGHSSVGYGMSSLVLGASATASGSGSAGGSGSGSASGGGALPPHHPPHHRRHHHRRHHRHRTHSPQLHPSLSVSRSGDASPDSRSGEDIAIPFDEEMGDTPLWGFRHQWEGSDWDESTREDGSRRGGIQVPQGAVEESNRGGDGDGEDDDDPGGLLAGLAVWSDSYDKLRAEHDKLREESGKGKKSPPKKPLHIQPPAMRPRPDRARTVGAPTPMHSLGPRRSIQPQAMGPVSGIRQGLKAVIVEGPGRYYIGIIDVLQTYTIAKRLERFIKTIIFLQPSAGVSTAPPDLYATRFRVRVINQIISDYRVAGRRSRRGHASARDARNSLKRLPKE